MQQLIHKTTKTQSLKIFFLLASASLCATYFLLSTQTLGKSISLLNLHHYYSSSQDDVSNNKATTLDHIVFSIASSGSSWPKRKEYTKLWWNNNTMRGCVFVDTLPIEHNSIANHNDIGSSLPPLFVSEDTSRFRYTYPRGGSRAAIRIARVVKETLALNHSGVRWYVFGDDDTIFFPENLVKTLNKYDHRLWYYIGSNSESYQENWTFGFGMAFGGAGFAISSSLAKVLAKVFDLCIKRYPHLMGSDDRVYSCITELGIGLTLELGFHQVDLRGNAFGLLAAHPVTPLLSLHHPDSIDPIFPNMTTTKSLHHLFEAVNVDSQRILQQTICYDKQFSWTISVSWGYAIQVFQNPMVFTDVMRVQKTFKDWLRGNVFRTLYNFNIKEFHPDPCKRPTIFYLENLSFGKDGIITSNYRKSFQNCPYNVKSPNRLELIKVVSKKLDLDMKQLKSPRRHCCDVLSSTAHDKMKIEIRECKNDELIYMH